MPRGTAPTFVQTVNTFVQTPRNWQFLAILGGISLCPLNSMNYQKSFIDQFHWKSSNALVNIVSSSCRTASFLSPIQRVVQLRNPNGFTSDTRSAKFLFHSKSLDTNGSAKVISDERPKDGDSLLNFSEELTTGLRRVWPHCADATKLIYNPALNHGPLDIVDKVIHHHH